MNEKPSFIAKHIDAIPFSGIRKFFDVAAEIEGVISLGVGEPDFKTPLKARQAAVENIMNGSTKYTSNSGILEMRHQISKYLEDFIGLHYEAEGQILVTVGASEGADIALRAIINPGDEILYNEPCYVSYRPCIEMAGGIPVAVETRAENDFRLMSEDVEKAITPKTKALFMSFPSNPTGAIMEYPDLEKLVNVLRDKNILVISDEIYGELTYGGKKHVSIASFPGMYERTVILSGYSKAFAMTGWRLGYAAGPAEVISAMAKIHEFAIMCAPTTSQRAAIVAMSECLDTISDMREEYDRRRRFVVDAFRALGAECFEPLGAFYVFPSITSTGMTSEEFCEKLLHEEKVAVVPGNAFGACGEGFIRVSYAYSMEELEKALSKIEKFYKNHKL